MPEKFSEFTPTDDLDYVVGLKNGANARTPLSPSTRWIKVTKSYTDFAAASTTNDIEIYSLPAKGVVQAITLKHNASFTGGAISGYTISVGVPGDLEKYINTTDVFTAPSDTTFNDGDMLNEVEDFGSTTSIRAQAISTDANLNAATQGTVDFYLLISTLP